MSDIPELDKIIEESENIRRNKKYQRQDKIFKILTLFLILSFPLFFLFILFFGKETGAIIFTVFFILILIPILCESVFEAICFLLNDDWKNVDMTKRYKRM